MPLISGCCYPISLISTFTLRFVINTLSFYCSVFAAVTSKLTSHAFRFLWRLCRSHISRPLFEWYKSIWYLHCPCAHLLVFTPVRVVFFCWKLFRNCCWRVVVRLEILKNWTGAFINESGQTIFNRVWELQNLTTAFCIYCSNLCIVVILVNIKFYPFSYFTNWLSCLVWVHCLLLFKIFSNALASALFLIINKRN